MPQHLTGTSHSSAFWEWQTSADTDYRMTPIPESHNRHKIPLKPRAVSWQSI